MVDDTLVRNILLLSFGPARDFTQVCILHHEIHLIVRVWRKVLMPSERFHDIVMVKFAPELHFVFDLVFNPPHTQALRCLYYTFQGG